MNVRGVAAALALAVGLLSACSSSGVSKATAREQWSAAMSASRGPLQALIDATGPYMSGDAVGAALATLGPAASALDRLDATLDADHWPSKAITHDVSQFVGAGVLLAGDLRDPTGSLITNGDEDMRAWTMAGETVKQDLGLN